MRIKVIKPLLVGVVTVLLSGCMTLPKWVGGGDERPSESAATEASGGQVVKPQLDEVRTRQPVNRGQPRWQSVSNSVMNLVESTEKIDDRPPLIAAMPQGLEAEGNKVALDQGVSYNKYVKERGALPIPGQPLEPQAVMTLDGYERQIKQNKRELGQEDISAPALERPAPRAISLQSSAIKKSVPQPSRVMQQEPEPAKTFRKPTRGYFVQVLSSLDRAQIEQELKRQSSWKDSKVVKLRKNVKSKELYYIVILGPYPNLSVARQILTKPNIPPDAWVRSAASIRKLWP